MRAAAIDGPEALAFYQSRGYTQTANFGYRAESEPSQSFVKTLD